VTSASLAVPIRSQDYQILETASTYININRLGVVRERAAQNDRHIGIPGEVTPNLRARAGCSRQPLIFRAGVPNLAAEAPQTLELNQR
jgi:hypothetical protein